MLTASRTSISNGVLNDVTCHVRMQYICNGSKVLLDKLTMLREKK